MHDYLISLIRTGVPVLVGAVLAWLAASADIVVDEDSSANLVAGVTALVSAAYYAAVRALEQRWPWVGWLLGKPEAPTYGRPASDAGAVLEAYPTDESE